MKNRLWLWAAILLFFLGLVIAAPANISAGGQSGCGMKPNVMKPMVPMGCKDLVQQCVCDNKGQHCHWGWVCVPADKRGESGCGMRPNVMKPMVPMGCKDVALQCVCDNGKNCRWAWVCVPW